MIKKILNKPLMIAPQSLDVISRAEWFELCGKLISERYGCVEVVPVRGLLTKEPTLMSSFFGMTSYVDIESGISAALDDREVKSILLDIDSPGGEVSGLFDLVDFIYESRNVKPIYAIANDYAFSAAYAIASAASKIFVNRTSGVGSIGVIATHVDQSDYDKKEGIKYTTIFAGDKKNDLSPHEPPTKNAISDLQKEVDRLYEMFVATVARNRGISSEQIKGTQAGLYYSSNAISFGLADEVSDFGKCLQIIGVKMSEDIDLYRADVLEISKLCRLAHAEEKLEEFIESGLSPDEVREKLLAFVSTQNEIMSTVYHKESVQENPLITAAKARAKIIA
jgi:signal peptide peptidase SppA